MTRHTEDTELSGDDEDSDGDAETDTSWLEGRKALGDTVCPYLC